MVNFKWGENMLVIDEFEELDRIINIINGILYDCLGDVPDLQQSILEVDGNSLQLARIAANIQRELNIDFQIIQFFMYPTVSSIAKYALSNLYNKKSLEGDQK